MPTATTCLCLEKVQQQGWEGLGPGSAEEMGWWFGLGQIGEPRMRQGCVSVVTLIALRSSSPWWWSIDLVLMTMKVFWHISWSPLSPSACGWVAVGFALAWGKASEPGLPFPRPGYC